MEYKNVIQGAQNKAAGNAFEKILLSACEYYSEKGIAEIDKTPEPMKVIKALKNGQFIAIFEKRAQPDFKGTLQNGRSIVFEAKHTSTDRLLSSVVRPEQEERLNRHEKMGAACYVVASFDYKKYIRVPWSDFKQMKELFGRKYIGIDDDLSKYEIKFKNGSLDFLGGIEL